MPSDTDLNNLKSESNYYSRSVAISSSLKNCPTTQPFKLNIFNPVNKAYGTYWVQEIIDSNAQSYIRALLGSGAWTKWRKLSYAEVEPVNAI